MDKSSDKASVGMTYLLVVAASIGTVTVTVCNGLFAIIAGADLNLTDEWGVFLFQIMIVSIPFVLMAFAGIHSLKPWLVGCLLTAAFWGYYFYVGISSRGDNTGANIGLGLLMLVSPILISGACIFIARWRGQGRT
jgi:hypothetical protein